MPTIAELDAAVGLVEQRLVNLSDALPRRDAQATEADAHALQRALSHAIDAVVAAARTGGVPAALRQRLARVSAQVARQREALARATAALDRAIDVLMPSSTPRSLYSAHGLPEPPGNGGGSITA